jgi:hypothetical protein
MLASRKNDLAILNMKEAVTEDISDDQASFIF